MGDSAFKPDRRLDGLAPLPVSLPRSPEITPSASSTPVPPPEPAVSKDLPKRPFYKWRPWRKRGEIRKPQTARRRWIKRILLAFAALVILTAGYLGGTTLLAVHHIIVQHKGASAPALSGKVNPSQLIGEGDGRINVLVLGIGGGDHDGPLLSDTMMVLSIDPISKQVAMLSIPRDLYVRIPGYGYNKINAANADGGPKLAEQVVENVIDIPIQYYVQVDFSGFQQAVDAVGGINIDNTQVLNDPTYPCASNQGKECGFYLAPGQYHMNGALALEYVRCREGTCGNDFGRAARQQQVLVAIRQQALTLSTLTNPAKIANLISAIGNHVKTDLQLSDIEQLAAMVKNVDPSKITQNVLSTASTATQTALLVNYDSSAAGDALVPAAGMFNYSAIQNLAHSLFADPYITQENARVQVENGSGVAGEATAVVTALQAAHYNVAAPTNASSYYPHTEIIDYTDGKEPYTINYLQQLFNVTAQKEKAPPTASGTQPPQILIILGADYKGLAPTGG